MNKQELFNEFILKGRDLKQVADMVIKSPEVLKYLVSGLDETDTRIKPHLVLLC